MYTHLWGKQLSLNNVPSASQPLHTSIIKHTLARSLTHPEYEIEDEHQILDAHLSPGQRRHHRSLSTHNTEWKSKDHASGVRVPVSRRRLARAAVTLVRVGTEWVKRAHEKLRTDTSSLPHSSCQRSTLQPFSVAKSNVPRVKHFLHRSSCYFLRVYSPYALFSYARWSSCPSRGMSLLFIWSHHPRGLYSLRMTSWWNDVTQLEQSPKVSSTDQCFLLRHVRALHKIYNVNFHVSRYAGVNKWNIRKY